MKAECTEIYFILPKRILSYAKTMKAECTEIHFILPRRILSYAKIV